MVTIWGHLQKIAKAQLLLETEDLLRILFIRHVCVFWIKQTKEMPSQIYILHTFSIQRIELRTIACTMYILHILTIQRQHWEKYAFRLFHQYHRFEFFSSILMKTQNVVSTNLRRHIYCAYVFFILFICFFATFVLIKGKQFKMGKELGIYKKKTREKGGERLSESDRRNGRK